MSIIEEAKRQRITVEEFSDGFCLRVGNTSAYFSDGELDYISCFGDNKQAVTDFERMICFLENNGINVSNVYVDAGVVVTDPKEEPFYCSQCGDTNNNHFELLLAETGIGIIVKETYGCYGSNRWELDFDEPVSSITELHTSSKVLRELEKAVKALNGINDVLKR